MPDEALGEIVAAAVESALAQAYALSDQHTQHAVDRAVRDANLERDVRDHQEHLTKINGSQEAMARSLREVQKSLESLSSTFRLQAQVQEALAASVRDQRERGFTRWQIWGAILGTIAAYGSIVAILVTHG